MKITLTIGDKGLPFFRVDSVLVETKTGLKAIREKYKLSREGLSDICGASSERIVESWEQGRFIPSKPAMMLLKAWLKEKEKQRNKDI